MLNDKSKQVIATVITSIGHLWSYTKMAKDEEIIKKIIKFTKDKNPNIRISSVMTLSVLYNDNNIEVIIKDIMNNDENCEVQEWAEVALEILLDID